jgi:hypothetical protein
MSTFMATRVLDALGNAAPFSVAQVHVQLHVGPPGAAGTANPAVETRRMPVSFAVAAGSVISNDVSVTWATIAGAQDPTHFTGWDAPSGGNFLFSGLVESAPYAAGNTLQFSPGALYASLQTAS